MLNIFKYKIFLSKIILKNQLILHLIIKYTTAVKSDRKDKNRFCIMSTTLSINSVLLNFLFIQETILSQFP